MRFSRRAIASAVLSLLVIFAVVLGLAVGVNRTAHAASPTITLSPNSGPPSTNVTVNGTAFIAGDSVTVKFDSTPVATATVTSKGQFQATFAIPSGASTNNHTVSAFGVSSGTASAPFLVPANWPTLGFDAQQDHFNSVENILGTSNISQLTSMWSAATRPGLSSEPVEANGLVYVDTATTSDTPGTVYAFSATTGAAIWQFQLQNIAPYNTYSFNSNSVAIDTIDNIAVAAAGISTGSNPGGLLYAFDAAKGGTPLWTVNIGSASTSPVINYETINSVLTPVVYVGTVDKLFYKINATNGTVIWTATLGGVVDAPSIANSMVLVGTGTHVQALDITTGKLLWSRSMPGTVTGQAASNGVLYITSQAPASSSGPDLIATSLTSTPPNKLLWEYPDPGVASDGASYSSVAVANGFAYVGSGNAAATNAFSVFNAAGCGKGITVCSPVWSAANGGSSTNLTVANGVVYGTFSDNTLQAYDASGCSGASTCASLWSTTGSSAYGNGITVINGVIYAGIVSGGVQAYFVYMPSGAAAISLVGLYNPVAGIAAGPPSTAITINGQNFGDNENVTITLGQNLAQTTIQAQAGGFSTKLTIPTTVQPGQYTVKASGAGTGRVAHAYFLVETNWNNFGFDTQRTHYNPYENVLNATNVKSTNMLLDWSYTTGNFIATSPAVANGLVYIASVDHKLYAIKAATGARRWYYNTTSPNYSSPTVANGVVYIFTYSSTLHALDATTGTRLWSAQLGPSGTGHPNQSSPVVVNGVIYIGSSDDNLYALDANNNGAVLWKAPTGNTINSSPAVVNGVVYVGSNDGKLYAFNAQTGAQLWTASTGSSIVASPTVANGNVYVGSTDGSLYVFSASGCGAATCTPLWTYSTNNQIFSSAAVANGVVYVGSDDGKFYAFSAASCGTATCAPLWTASVGAAITSSPTVANGVVYVGADNDNLYAFKAAGCGVATCTPIWTYTTGGAVNSSPTVVNGVVYFGSYDFNLYAFHL